MHRKPVPRLRHFDYAGGYRYFLTICTNGRMRAFLSHQAVDPVLAQLLRSATDHGFAVIAYCFMPDHLHLLVEGSDPCARLPAFMQVFKQRSAFHWKAAFGGHLWQRSYFDRVLREEESTVDVARYVLANPLRAGMVTRVEDYPFLGSVTLSIRDLLGSLSTDQNGGPT